MNDRDTGSTGSWKGLDPDCRAALRIEEEKPLAGRVGGGRHGGIIGVDPPAKAGIVTGIDIVGAAPGHHNHSVNEWKVDRLSLIHI